MTGGFRYSIYVNQKTAMELGISSINQAVVFDLLANASSWAEAIVIDGEVFYWVARQAVCSQLPLLGLKPDSAYRHFKALAVIELIDYVKVGKKDCIRTTEKGREYFSAMSEINPSTGDNSEINPNKLGNKSESNSEINPTYKTNNTTNKDISDKDPFSEMMQKYGVDKKFIDEILKHRRNIRSKKPSPAAMNLILLGMVRTVQQGLMPSMDACLNHLVTETTWQGFKPEYLANTKKQNSRATPADQGGSIAATHERMKRINWGGTPDDNKRI